MLRAFSLHVLFVLIALNNGFHHGDERSDLKGTILISD